MKNAPHPGEIIRELYQNGMADDELAAKTDIEESLLLLILQGKHGVDKEIAAKLEKAFPNSKAMTWLKLQKQFEESKNICCMKNEYKDIE